MKTTKSWSKMLLLGISAMVLSFGLMSCTTTKYTRSDPLALEQTGDYAVLRLTGYALNTRPFAKFDNAILTSNEILLPVGTAEYDVKFIVAGNVHKYAIQAKVPLTLEAGKTYLLAAEITAASRAAAFVFSFAPRHFNFVTYEYSSDLKNKTQMNTVDPVELTMEEF
jgi:hypothetical protein